MSGIMLLVVFVISIIVMILAITKLNVHPFLAIMGIALIMGLVVGIPMKDMPGVIGEGFSATFASIGIVIILGALIGSVLEATGGAIKLADMVVNAVGEKRPELAIMIMGWIVSVPVFCDSGFVILNPIRKAMARKTGASSVAMTIALSAGLYSTHVYVPPTPGPIAAAGNIGVENNLLMVIVMGVLVSIPGMILAYLFAKKIGPTIKSSDEISNEKIMEDYKKIMKEHELPNGFLSLAPIIVPIILMAASSIVQMAKYTGTGSNIIMFLGTPVIALAAGVIFSVFLLLSTKTMDKFNKITEETLRTVGPILFITGAGGVLGKVISTAGFVEYIEANAEVLSKVGIFFPFLISAILKTAQGSSTVALTTTSAIMGMYTDPHSMMSALGLTSPMTAVLVVLAIGAGAMTVSHANDSYFWVVTNLGGLKAEEGYKTQTPMTLIMGLAGMATVFVLNMFLG
ncbi:GntP family permease [Miniphocaeibacter massiliensis]|uniref:GntP family permease n=1 Tax=Miniphocaeibacter massiliensis TaxID=2041841 RepID=UPI000C1B86B2|nr:GntP family permease [Miniphocaeibacter massiliensis]